ncbi:MAG: molybdate ABC transporter substrate-binding protein [Crocinitomicaceae bacterium]|nr:molybdate ABC transporter substrate-binding protein [Crocinitomicaceae bacterium]
MKHFLILLVLIMFFGCQSEKKIRIATSANMQFATEELIEEFKKDHDVEFDLVINSSGNLYAQIKNGAPFDLFIAANQKYPEELFKADLTIEKPKTYAIGKLILWTSQNIEPSIELLTSDQIQKIGIANPATAPYGKQSVNCLKNLGIYEKVKDKLVYGESISQTNVFISSGSVDIGFTALSVVSSPDMKNKGRYIEIEPSLYTPIQQDVALLNHSKEKEICREFYAFLSSETAQKILLKHGYSVPESKP